MKHIKEFSQFSIFEQNIDSEWVGNIDDATEDNEMYRKVLFTGSKLQLVLMSIPPGQEIGEEVHEDGDQFLRFEEGKGQVLINDKTYEVEGDWAVTIPAGSRHNVINTGTEPLKLYSVYAPPVHEPGLVQAENPNK
jgi:mannose-6-phosphate isomerase-like protein (cupin superfamily)